MKSDGTPSRIVLIGDYHKHEEAIAGAALYPGHLIHQQADGTVIKNAGAGVKAEILLALEDALQGRGIETPYAEGERVSIGIPEKGAVVYVWLSGGENADKGEFLTPNGDGTFKVSSGSDYRMLKVMEAVDASDSNDVDERIKARVI